MYDAEQADIERLRVRFEADVAEGAAGARGAGLAYMAALGVFVDAFNEGPGADSRRMDGDTTGTLQRIEDSVERAEAERHRVRRAMTLLV